MYEQSENFNKMIESIKIYQTEITNLRNVIIELKNSIEGLNSGLDHTEERISKLTDRAVEFIHQRGKKEKE